MIEFPNSETDIQIIKNLNISEDEISLLNTPLKLLIKEDKVLAVHIKDRIFNEAIRLKEEQKAQEKQVPYWEQTKNITHQVRKFY